MNINDRKSAKLLIKFNTTKTNMRKLLTFESILTFIKIESRMNHLISQKCLLLN